MLQVDLDNILPEEDALQKINDIFAHVENEKEVYVVTKNGRPAVAIISIDQLEQSFGSVSSAPAAGMPAAAPLVEESMPAAPMPSMPALPDEPIVPAMEQPAPQMPAMPSSPMDEELDEVPSAPLGALPPLPPLPTYPGASQPAAPAAPMAPPPPAAPAPSNLPPLTGSMDLPSVDEDPRNSSPLA